MNTEQQFERVVEGYKAQGYEVVVRPGPAVLPPFAKDFKVEILATSADGNVLTSVRTSAEELEADANVPRYMEITNRQPGWRLDILIIGTSSHLTKKQLKFVEPTDEDVRKALEEVERLHQAGFVAHSLSAAWAVLEAMMRRCMRAMGETIHCDDESRTILDILYSNGAFLTATYRELERLLHRRTEIVDGFVAGEVELTAVHFVVETARNLRTFSQPVKLTA